MCCFTYLKHSITHRYDPPSESSCKRAPRRRTPALSTRPRCGIRRPHNHRQARRKQGCTVRFDGEREAALDEPKRLWMVAHLMREAIRRPSGGQSGGQSGGHQMPSEVRFVRSASLTMRFMGEQGVRRATRSDRDRATLWLHARAHASGPWHSRYASRGLSSSTSACNRRATANCAHRSSKRVRSGAHDLIRYSSKEPHQVTSGFQLQVGTSTIGLQ